METYFHLAAVPNSAEAARSILAEFSLLEALNAERYALDKRCGTHAAQLLVAAKSLLDCANYIGLRGRPIVPRPPELVEFLQQLLGYRPTESLVVLYADSSGRLICADEIASGGPLGVEVDLRRIVLHALERAACGLIMVHNHPSGDPRPSSADLRVTRDLADALRPFGINLIDHVVVAQGAAKSALHKNYDDHWN